MNSLSELTIFQLCGANTFINHNLDMSYTMSAFKKPQINNFHNVSPANPTMQMKLTKDHHASHTNDDLEAPAQNNFSRP